MTSVSKTGIRSSPLSDHAKSSFHKLVHNTNSAYQTNADGELGHPKLVTKTSPLSTLEH